MSTDSARGPYVRGRAARAFWFVFRNLPFGVVFTASFFWVGPLKTIVLAFAWTGVTAWEVGFDKGSRGSSS